MKRWLVPSFLLTAVVVAVAAVPRVSRDALHAMEISFDKRIQTPSVDDPFELLGNTRGVYLEGYGAVFTAEVNLLHSANVSPFQPDHAQGVRGQAPPAKSYSGSACSRNPCRRRCSRWPPRWTPSPLTSGSPWA